MELKQEKWGVYKGQQTDLFTIKDPTSDFFVQLTNFGAGIVRVKVPDRRGNIDDVNFGQNSPGEYIKHGEYLSATIGRFANRIENAHFILEGQEYNLFKNNGEHSLHGGKEGFNFKTWKIVDTKISDHQVEITFQYFSPDDEENYPGNLTSTIVFKISNMKIAWEIKAVTDKTTYVNLTNHAYWNLDGLESLNIDLELKVKADYIMIFDDDLIPTGEIISLSNNGLDLRKSKKLSQLYNNIGDVDNNYILSDYVPLQYNPKFAAELYSPKTGRNMKIYTTEPCILIYTGNFMGKISSFGKPCKKHNAICLETQHYPNAMNIPFLASSVILKPGEEYYHSTIHEFSIEK